MIGVGGRVVIPRLDVAHGAMDLLVGLVLAKRVDGPDGGGQPTDESDLQDEADDSGEGPADGEEGQPGEKECDDESQVQASLVGLVGLPNHAKANMIKIRICAVISSRLSCHPLR